MKHKKAFYGKLRPRKLACLLNNIYDTGEFENKEMEKEVTTLKKLHIMIGCLK